VEKRGRYVPALGYDWLTALYDPVVALTTREGTFKRRLIQQARIPEGAQVLDLGCGTGTLAIWVKQAHPRAEVTGLDGDPKVLAVAGKKARSAGMPIRFDRGMSFALPYEDDSFDRVLSSLFFHHLADSDKERTLREVHRVLKPGGELHAADWGRASGALSRVLFFSVRVLDGFETTRASVIGLLPKLIGRAGFAEVREQSRVETMQGTLALYCAQKPRL